MEKRKIIIVFIVLILIVIVGLWGSGIIPKRIARISASNYLEKNFPKMQLEYVDIEWSSSFGGYSIKFKDANNKTYSFIMNNKYFPISLGQGLFAFEEEYRQKYEWQDTNIENNEESYFYGKVIESNAKYIIVEPNENEEERKSADKISVGLGENNDALYTIGTNVKITYDGTILESYPAQVKATKIEIKSAVPAARQKERKEHEKEEVSGSAADRRHGAGRPHRLQQRHRDHRGEHWWGCVRRERRRRL